MTTLSQRHGPVPGGLEEAKSDRRTKEEGDQEGDEEEAEEGDDELR